MTPDMNSLPIQDFPESLLTMMEHGVPKEAILQLVEHYGGTRLSVPVRFSEGGALGQVIDRKAGEALCAAYGGDIVEIPLSVRLRTVARDREIVRKRRDERLSQSALARLFGLSERSVRRILKTTAG
ncbi:MAG: Mor transcription activator family protein [Methylococcus sp.]|nr:Mor transcription activator family protein [Methylococcus sp.]